MFGAPWSRDLNPLVKNFPLMIITIRASSIWVSVRARWLWTRKAGSGNPAIWCPMVMYMSTSRKPTESRSLRFSTGVSRSFRASSSAFSASAPRLSAAAPFRLAP